MDVSIKANRGILISEPSQLHLTGGAEMKDSVWTLFADSISYYENGKEARATGHMRALDKKRTVIAGAARYLKESQIIQAYRGVSVKDDSLEAKLFGREVTLNDSTGYGLVVGYPSVEKMESGNLVTITGKDSMEVFRKDRLFRVWKNVVMKRDSITTHSDKLEYVDNDSTGVVTLIQSPSIDYEFMEDRDGAPSMLHTTSRVTGDSIVVFLKGRKVSGAEVIGRAVTTTTSLDSTGTIFDRSVIESNNIKFTMDDKAIDYILASGYARSYYHRRNADTAKMFVNVANGDTLHLGFDKGKMKSMKIIGAGGGPGKGTYYDYTPVKAATDTNKTE
jgi:lipopolysaccharide export system protein LptA